MRVLITGGSGYFAWELIRQLKIQEQYEIIVASSDPVKLEGDSNYSDVEIIDNEELWQNDDLMRSIDAVIHTAFCRKSVGEQLVNSLKFSKKLFSRAVACDVPAVINLSSQSVYGSENEKLPSEEDPCEPEYLYALAKSASELLAETIMEKSSTTFTNIRAASMVGPSMNVPVNVLYKFVENALSGRDINIQGGRQNFSFIDVRDTADAVIRLLDVPPEQWETVYNLGPEKQTNIVELAEIAVNYAVSIGKDAVRICIKEDDIALNAGMNSERLYEAIGWRPQFSMEDIVKATGDRLIRR